MGLKNGTDVAQNGSSKCAESDLAHIEFPGNNPFELFKQWLAESRNSSLVTPDALCLSTCSKEGKPSSRHVLLRRLDDDGFVIMTDGRSRKAEELAENPHASMAFLWCFIKNGQKISKQVRIEGHVEEMPQSACQEIWDREPIFCKIRANICDQGRPVNWEEHKRKHDHLYEEIINNHRIPSIPNHVAFYKVIPSFMEFYYAYDNAIGDRLAFQGVNSEGKVWKVERIAA